jgi:hypothetical protein
MTDPLLFFRCRNVSVAASGHLAVLAVIAGIAVVAMLAGLWLGFR